MEEHSAKITLVVGLGNPGREYIQSRHNVGFMVVEKLLALLPGRFDESHVAESRFFSGRFRGGNLYLLLPQTYMNESGKAVAGICRKLHLMPEEVLVVSDDLDLPVGELRLRSSGSAGGHNGLKSIIAELASEKFNRVRVGIGRPLPGGTVDYVLSEFDEKELPLMEAGISDAAEAVKLALSRGMARATNQFSGKARGSQVECAKNPVTDSEKSI